MISDSTGLSNIIGSLDSIILSNVSNLSKEEQRQYLSLHNAHPEMKPFSGIFKTNALSCGSDSPVGAIYPTICLINHSCVPNAHNSWNYEAHHETIHAIRDIKAGEDSKQRCPKLKSSFRFDRTCTLCSSPAHEIQESDTRLLEMERLDEAIGDPRRTMNAPDRAIADCRKKLDVVKEEYGPEASAPLQARLYYDAFQINVTHSDQARASVCAERAYRARVTCEGEDSPEAKRMERLMQNPTQHLHVHRALCTAIYRQPTHHHLLRSYQR